jgi:hypothetical protein
MQLPLEVRWAGRGAALTCFICDLGVDRTAGYITGQDTRDRHSRVAHIWCWTLVLRYAQCVLDAQRAGEALKCQ